MENKKYYTPDIGDLYIGFEYEQFSHLSGEWNKEILDYSHFMTILDEEENDWSEHHIRVPFLTREQIEKEGYLVEFLNPGGYYINLLDNHRIHIYHYNDDFFFLGNCPSVNEFRKIIKLLGIDGK